ncbi:MAG: SPOR domain-containing protein [Pseudomonadota bacterium]|nr:SPOR domain-containing protein [Pseudomonadota bacterium]
MRHPATPRKMAGFTGLPMARGLAALAMAAMLPACTTFAKKDDGSVITGPAADDLAWSFARTAELEAQVAKLESENTRLTKRVAQLEAASAPKPDKPAETAAAEAPAPKPAPATPLVKPEAVVAAPEADRALAGAPAPVDSSPRLVQPSFASVEETVFENEAAGAIPLSSVLYGVHLASYRHEAEARSGWRKLQRENPDELGLLEPRVEKVSIEDRGEFLRLVGGGFTTQEKASALCARLKSKGVYCSVTSFDGQRLSLSDGNSG